MKEKENNKYEYIRYAFLIGNEARGLSEDAAALCDAWVKIPMPGQAESLNASVAAGVLLYEVVRQRLPK